jgi:phosphohistidine phosphatase SixA
LFTIRLAFAMSGGDTRRSLADFERLLVRDGTDDRRRMGAQLVRPRKPSETTSRPSTSDVPPPLPESGVRAALRQRRQRRLEEAGMQSLVRAMAGQLSPSERGS